MPCLCRVFCSQDACSTGCVALGLIFCAAPPLPPRGPESLPSSLVSHWRSWLPSPLMISSDSGVGHCISLARCYSGPLSHLVWTRVLEQVNVAVCLACLLGRAVHSRDYYSVRVWSIWWWRSLLYGTSVHHVSYLLCEDPCWMTSHTSFDYICCVVYLLKYVLTFLNCSAHMLRADAMADW